MSHIVDEPYFINMYLIAYVFILKAFEKTHLAKASLHIELPYGLDFLRRLNSTD